MTSTIYNQDKLAEAIKAFGEERLEELREEFPRGRLAEQEGDVYLHIHESSSGWILTIDKLGEAEEHFESDFTYLEPPRPFSGKHTYEDMEDAFLTGYLSTDFEEYYSANFPTATAPTEEVHEVKGYIDTKNPEKSHIISNTITEEQIDTSAIEFPSDDSLLATGQPQPSFTREEMLTEAERELIQMCIQCAKDADKIQYGIANHLNEALKKFTCQPLPSRLDLLIKWWGEQERPSEITFGDYCNIEPKNSYWNISHSINKHSTHYRRGTSEWIKLPTLNEGE